MKPRVIACVFEDWKGEGYKLISFFLKRASVAMVPFAIQRRITTPAALQSFDADDYAFAPSVSTPQRLVFRRRTA